MNNDPALLDTRKSAIILSPRRSVSPGEAGGGRLATQEEIELINDITKKMTPRSKAREGSKLAMAKNMISELKATAESL